MLRDQKEAKKNLLVLFCFFTVNMFLFSIFVGTFYLLQLITVTTVHLNQT